MWAHCSRSRMPPCEMTSRSCVDLDVTVEAATAHGARGARLTRAGFDGSAIALVPTERTAEVSSAVVDALGDVGFSAPKLPRRHGVRVRSRDS